MQQSLLWAVDMGITKTFVADVLESIGSFLRDLRVRGAVIGADAWANKDLNSPSSVSLGNLYLDYEFTPVYPAYQIRLRRTLTTKYLATLFAA